MKHHRDAEFSIASVFALAVSEENALDPRL